MIPRRVRGTLRRGMRRPIFQFGSLDRSIGMGRFGVAVTAFLGACLVAVLALGGNRFVPTASAASASTYVALGDSYASGRALVTMNQAPT